MDFGAILGRAWQITWRWKALWLLGFLAALGQGGGGANSSYSFSSDDFQNGNLPNINLAALEGVIVALACLALIVAIALFALSVIARGGLIAGVAQVEDEGSTSLRRAWRVGLSRFWTLFGIGVLVAIPVILVGVVMAVGIFLIAGGAALTSFNGGEAAIPALAGLFACICPSICLLIILTVVLGQIQIYAERAAVLEGLGWIDAFKRGWQVLKDNLGATVVFWLIFLVLGLVIAAITFVVMLPILLPAAALFGLTEPSSSAAWLLVPICGVGLVAVIVGAIVSAVVTTFTSASWTLLFRRLTAPAVPAPAAQVDAPLLEG